MTRRFLEGFLYCLVGADQYAFRGADVSLVARAGQMRDDVPIHDLAALLGRRSDAGPADRYVIVTGQGASACGFLVDRIVRSTTAKADVLPLPDVAGADALRRFEGVVTLAETSCLVLVPDGLRPDPSPRPERALLAPRKVPRAAAGRDTGLLVAFRSPSLPRFAIEHYAVSATRVAAVAQSIPVIAAPGCDRHVAGLGVWRRSVVAVLDSSPDARATSSARRFLILHTSGGSLVALAIDADTLLRRASPQDARTAYPELPHFVRGVFNAGDIPVALLDVDRLAAGSDVMSARVPDGDRVQIPALV